MTARNAAKRLKEMLNPPEVTSPAEELAEPREVAPGAEVSGPLLAHHLEFPEGLGPEWAPLLMEMRAELGEAVQNVVRELIAEGRPEPLVAFGQAAANAAGVAEVRFAPVPLATVWEVTNLFASHAEAGSENVAVNLEPGGQIDGFAVPTAVGGSAGWSGPLYVRESVRLMVSASGLTAGENLNVAIFGRMHSTRNSQG